jgi:hypothetical protein
VQQIFPKRKLAAAAIGCALTASGLVGCALIIEPSCGSLESSYRELAAEPVLAIAPPAAEIGKIEQSCDADGGWYYVIHEYSSAMGSEELKAFYRNKVTDLGFRQIPPQGGGDQGEYNMCFAQESENRGLLVRLRLFPAEPRFDLSVERSLDGSATDC